MTQALSMKIAAAETVCSAASVAAAAAAATPKGPPSAVSAGSLPSCSSERGTRNIGGQSFRGRWASGMYGQVFSAGGGAGRSAAEVKESKFRGGGGSSGNGRSEQGPPSANGPGRGGSGSGGSASENG